MSNHQPEIQSVVEAAREQPGEQPESHRQLVLTAYGMTDPGRQRAANEDQFAIAEARRVLQVKQSSIPQPEALVGDPLGHLLIVADGIGGHRGGQYASALAVVGVENLLVNTMGWLCQLQGEGVIRELHEALRTADRWVDEAGGRNVDLRGMGTTLTMVYATGSSFYIAHAGDSRCYRWQGGDLQRLTRDHTVVASLVSAGALTVEEAAHHTMRNVVTNAVGGGTRGVQPDVDKHAARAGDLLLLCTDGLTTVMADDDIAAVLRREMPPADTCRHLVDEANNRGGPDNVTVIVARFEGTRH